MSLPARIENELDRLAARGAGQGNMTLDVDGGAAANPLHGCRQPGLRLRTTSLRQRPVGRGFDRRPPATSRTAFRQNDLLAGVDQSDRNRQRGLRGPDAVQPSRAGRRWFQVLRVGRLPRGDPLVALRQDRRSAATGRPRRGDARGLCPPGNRHRRLSGRSQRALSLRPEFDSVERGFSDLIRAPGDRPAGSLSRHCLLRARNHLDVP